MLIIDHLDKHYKGTDKGVTDISLHVEPGDIFAFIGHNGAGKTTLLKAITGIHEYDRGTVTIDGLNLAEHANEVKQRIAYIPDNPDIYEFLTGIQYLGFIADIYGVSAADREARIADYAERFEITGALGDTPKLLVMDEPFVGLDPKAAFVLKELMRELTAEGGAIFFSTHVLEVAEKLCNKVAIIKEGRIIASGEMSEVVKDGASLEDLFMETVAK